MTNKKLRLGILYGGTSPERMISFKTGLTIAQSIDLDKYYVIPIEISKEGRYIVRNLDELLNYKYSTSDYNLYSLEDQRIIFKTNIKTLLNCKLDAVFIALHGINGEDGTIQGLLECLKIPYTGSGVTASAIAIDKNITKQIYSFNRIRTPHWIKIASMEELNSENKPLSDKEFDYPLIVKPCKGGSSIGIGLADDFDAIFNVAQPLLSSRQEIIIEQYIHGVEVSCGVIGTGTQSKALPPVQVVHNKPFFDYISKYEVDNQGGTHEFSPAELPDNVISEIQSTALLIHNLLNCRGISATDYIIDSNLKIYAIETNTIPGLTSTNIIPKAIAAANIEFKTLLNCLIEDAIKNCNY